MARDTMWVDADGEGGWKCPSGKGGWLIVLHAGTVEGWVRELVFRAKSSTGDPDSYFMHLLNLDSLSLS